MRLAVLLLLAAPPARAARPFLTETAAVTEAGQTRIETGLDRRWLGGGERLDVLTVATKRGLPGRAELGVTVPYRVGRGTARDRAGWGDARISLKHVFLQPPRRSDAWAAAGVLTWKADSGDVRAGHGTNSEDLNLTLAGTSRREDGDFAYRVHASAGYTFTSGAPGRTGSYQASMASGSEFEKGRMLVLEITLESSPVRREKGHALTVSLGERQTLSESLTFDAALRRGLTGLAPEWTGGVGLTFSF